MKNLLALVGLAVVLAVGLGWYLGWYQIGTTPGSDGHRTINVDVNAKKIAQDVKRGEEEVNGVLSKNTPSFTPPPPGQMPQLPAAPTTRPIDGVPTSGITIRPNGSTTITLPPLQGSTPGN